MSWEISLGRTSVYLNEDWKIEMVVSTSVANLCWFVKKKKVTFKILKKSISRNFCCEIRERLRVASKIVFRFYMHFSKMATSKTRPKLATLTNTYYYLLQNCIYNLDFQSAESTNFIVKRKVRLEFHYVKSQRKVPFILMWKDKSKFPAHQLVHLCHQSTGKWTKRQIGTYENENT